MTACLSLSTSDIRLLLREYWIRYTPTCKKCNGNGSVPGYFAPGVWQYRDCRACRGAGKTGSEDMIADFLAADGDAYLQSKALQADPSVTSDNLLDRRMWLADRIAEMVEGGGRCR